MNTQIKAVVFSLLLVPGLSFAYANMDSSELEQFFEGAGAEQFVSGNVQYLSTKTMMEKDKDDMEMINEEIKQQPSAAGSTSVIDQILWNDISD